MAVKNFWSLEPGECIFAEELQERYKDKIDLYFPLKDSGIDLLSINKESGGIITFQIKESRYYYDKDKNWDSTWHQVNKKKLEENKDKVGFHIFLVYFPGYLAGTDEKKNEFKKYFIIIPTKELLERAKIKKANKNGKYDFYFRVDSNGKNVTETRESKDIVKSNPELFDYSKYLDAWDLIGKRLVE